MGRKKMRFRQVLSIVLAVLLVGNMMDITALATSEDAVDAVAEAGTTHIVSDSLSFEAALAQAADGDIIDITNGATILTTAGEELLPLVIDKSVTITGGELAVRKAGILLEADVTFKDMTLGIANNCRDAVWANGYTLTIDGVTGSSRKVDLFGGSLYMIQSASESTLYTGSNGPGNAGAIIIKGTNSGFGNIYAGSMNGSFGGNVRIQLDKNLNNGTGTNVYCSGALEGSYDPDNFLDPYYQPDAPVANDTAFPVSGQVSVDLTYNSGITVNGVTGGAQNAAVTYTDGGKGYAFQTVLNNIGTLSLNNQTSSVPNLVLDGDSTLSSDMVVNLPANTKLDLTDFADEQQFTISGLNGGGTLILNSGQELTITGEVSGSTGVAIGSVSFDGVSSGGVVYREHNYIKAVNSVANESLKSFVLYPPSGETVDFERDENGNWWVPVGELPKIEKINTVLEDVLLETSMASAEEVIEILPVSIEVTVEDELYDLFIDWSCENFSTAEGAVNVFTWTVPDSETDGWFDPSEVTLTGTIKVTNPGEGLPEATVVWPEAGALTYGQTLSESILSGGSTEYGTFVWEDGTIVPKAGQASYTVIFTPSDEALQNYTGLAVMNKKVTVNVAKKSGYTVRAISKEYLYAAEHADSVDLAVLLPQDCGEVSYSVPTVSGAVGYSVTPVVNEGILSYTVQSGVVGAEGTITVVAETDNYEDITLAVAIELIDRIAVSLKTGTEVVLEKNELTYGESLANLVFKENTAEFVGEDGKVVTGSLAWKEPSLKPDAGTVMAEWVFTPEIAEYAWTNGMLEIQVKKAVPDVSIPKDLTAIYGQVLKEVELPVGWKWDNDTKSVGAVGQQEFDAVFTSKDSDNYATVTKRLMVEVGAKKIEVRSAGAEDRGYDGTNTVQITGVTLNGVVAGDEVAVNVEKLTGTLSDKVAGEYTSVTLPELTLTGADADNYVLTQPTEAVSTQVTISKAKAAITPKYDSYTKIYNDPAFSIAGDITTVGESALVYSVSDGVDAEGKAKAASDIVTVSKDGVVTVVGSGSVKVSLNMAESANYEAAETKTITIQVLAWEDVPRDGFFVKAVSTEKYTGKAIKPEPEVWDGNGELCLEKGRDYTISYKNNKNAYTLKEGEEGFNAKKAPTMIIKGKGNYDQKLTVYFTIQPRDIANLTDTSIEADDILVEANGKVQKKSPVIKVNGKKLGKNDFTVTYPALEDATLSAVAYKESGTYPVVITGKGNYTGSRTVNLIVAAKGTSLAKASIAKIPAQEFDGVNAVELDDTELVVTAKINGKKETLKKGVHYIVEYANNKAVGTATVTVKAIEGSGFAGFKKATFKVNGVSIAKAKVEGVENRVYTGSAQKLALKITASVKDVATGAVQDVILTEGTDYKVAYSKNTNVGTDTVTITGMGRYTGTIKKSFKITAADMADIVTAKDGQLTAKYLKGGAKPSLNLVFNGKKLTEGRDYTVTYKNNKAVYTAKAGENGYDVKKAPAVTIKGKGNFAGSVSRTYTITGRSLANADVAVTMSVADKAVSDKKGGYISKVAITDADGKVLKQGTDYSAPVYTMVNEKGETVTLTKEDTAPVGSVITVSVTGMGAYEDAEGKVLTATYRITVNDFTKAKVQTIQKKYTGKAVELTAADFVNEDGSSKVTFGSGKNATQLVYGKDFEVVPGSYKNNLKKGTATVTIQGCGEYGGTKTVKFKIGARSLWFWWL